MVSTIGENAMQFVFDGKVYKAVKITGPKHNMLGLSFAEDNEDVSNIDVLSLDIKSETEKNISALEVKNQVLSSIKEMNSLLGVHYKIKQIQFISSDTPSSTVYKELTREIIKRLISGYKFTLSK